MYVAMGILVIIGWGKTWHIIWTDGDLILQWEINSLTTGKFEYNFR